MAVSLLNPRAPPLVSCTWYPRSTQSTRGTTGVNGIAENDRRRLSAMSRGPHKGKVLPSNFRPGGGHGGWDGISGTSDAVRFESLVIARLILVGLTHGTFGKTDGRMIFLVELHHAVGDDLFVGSLPPCPVCCSRHSSPHPVVFLLNERPLYDLPSTGVGTDDSTGQDREKTASVCKYR